MAKLEEQFAGPYADWKKAPGPATVGPLLTAAEPLLRAGAKRYAGGDDPINFGHARRLFLQGLPRYDPQRAALSTFVYSQLQGLRRPDRRAGRGVRVSDRVAADRYAVEESRRSLADENGREPTDDEVMDHAMIGPSRYAKALSYHPAVPQGALDAAANGAGGYEGVAVLGRTPTDGLQDLVYAGLPPGDQLVMSLALGRHGRQPLSNQEIAAKLRKSPGAVSQQKARIQKLLDEAAGLRERHGF